jgi:hypothetical protein
MESDTRWVSPDLGEDEFRLLSRLVVDFARNVGLHEAQDDDLLQLVIAAYLAGRSHDWGARRTPPRLLQ